MNLPNQTLLPAQADEAFDRYARISAQAFDIPIALITMVDRFHQIMPGSVGLPPHWQQTRTMPLTLSFCKHVFETGKAAFVNDLRLAPELSGSAVMEELDARAWAGAPILDPLANDDTSVVGVVCVIDKQPRNWSEAELLTL